MLHEPLGLRLAALMIVLHQCLRWESGSLSLLERAVVDRPYLIDADLPQRSPVVGCGLVGTKILMTQHLRERSIRIKRHVLRAFGASDVPAPRSTVWIDPKRHVVGGCSIDDARPWLDRRATSSRHIGFCPIAPRSRAIARQPGRPAEPRACVRQALAGGAGTTRSSPPHPSCDEGSQLDARIREAAESEACQIDDANARVFDD